MQWATWKDEEEKLDLNGTQMDAQILLNCPFSIISTLFTYIQGERMRTFSLQAQHAYQRPQGLPTKDLSAPVFLAHSWTKVMNCALFLLPSVWPVKRVVCQWNSEVLLRLPWWFRSRKNTCYGSSDNGDSGYTSFGHRPWKPSFTRKISLENV